MMGTIEILALILIIATAIKLITISINAKAWLKFARGVYKKPGFAQLIALLLAVLVLYYLLQVGIGILEILAVALFVALLLAMSFAYYVNDLIKKFNVKSMFKEQWLAILAWLALIVWGAIVLFA